MHARLCTCNRVSSCVVSDRFSDTSINHLHRRHAGEISGSSTLRAVACFCVADRAHSTCHKYDHVSLHFGSFLRDLPEAVQRRVDERIRKRRAEDEKAAAEAKLQKARRKAKRQKRAFLAGEKAKTDELMLTTELIERVAAELAEAEATVHLADAQAKQLGTGKKKLEPFYAYNGCSRCLDLAGEIGKLLGSHLLDRLNALFPA